MSETLPLFNPPAFGLPAAGFVDTALVISACVADLFEAILVYLIFLAASALPADSALL
jgi:hypothetical protein